LSGGSTERVNNNYDDSCPQFWRKLTKWGILSVIVSLTKDILRKIVHAGTIIALLTGAASAQIKTPGINLAPQDRQMTPEEKEKQKAVEDAYKSAIGKIPDKKTPVDPWGTVRSNPSPSPKPKQGQQ
jgi:hypothetical protein